MAKRKLTSEQEKEICELYLTTNYTLRKLEEFFPVNYETIRKILIRNKVKRRNKFIVSPGDKFGKWIAIKESHKNENGKYFTCECVCKKKVKRNIFIYDLINGKSTSCGCSSKETRNNNKENVIGNRYGKVVVIDEINKDKNSARIVLGKCDCNGNIKEYILNNLKNGTSKSCGCFALEVRTNSKKDYEERHPLFCKVEEIIDNPNAPGILVKCKKCNEWFKPTPSQIRGRVRAIETPEKVSIGTEQNLYCSAECKNSCSLYNLHSDPFKAVGNITSTELKQWRKEVLKRQRDEYGYNFCTKCQSTDNLRVHHIDPKKLEPFFALDPENGIIFCIKCHHNDGHSGECGTGVLAYTVCK